MEDEMTPEERREWLLNRIDRVGQIVQEQPKSAYWKGHLNALYVVARGLEDMDEDIIQKHIRKYTYPEDFDPLSEN